MPLKLEIKDKPQHVNSFHSTECTDDRVNTLSNVDDSEICHKNTETNQKSQVSDKKARRQWATEGTLDYPAKHNYSNAEASANTVRQISEGLPLKSKIKEEPIEYKFAASASFCACEISCENSKIDIIDTKLGEDASWKEKEPTNFYSTRNMNNEIYLKSEIEDEPMDDISTEYVGNIVEPVYKDDCSDGSCEDTKIDITHTSGNFVWIRPTHLTDNVEEVNEAGRKEENKLYQCEDCHAGFAQQIDLKKHKRLHTGEKPHQCDVCKKQFSQLSYLNTHKRLHTGKRLYQCDVCKKRFAFVSIFNAHKRTHTGEKPYQCDVCNKCFNESQKLKIHKRIHTGEKPYQCDVCNKCFAFDSSLTAHKRIHTGEKPYQCDVCDRCFTGSHHLKNHKRTHTGEKPYQCDVCNKFFNKSHNLKVHKRTHTDEKPYKCDVCNKCFTFLSNLKAHKRTHTGEKPYQCDVCNKCFRETHQLKSHKRTHTGEKPYQCHVCSKHFREMGHLNKHKLTHL